ncbi:MAG: hybrid sensor histidine kinase/response regulator [Anaerolineae bacterium]|nr:hybrid sensor histidine kinase/response regulator [Anaerolineae bacterium]
MGAHLLVVEDHRPLLGALKDILEAEGYTISTAADGVQALELMETFIPDLILADIMMPRMDGYTFYAAVRARSEWTPIPFIFLTAKGEQEDVLKGKGMGAEAYIIKPFDTRDLIVTIRSRLERAQAIRTSAETEFDRLKQQIITALGHELRTPLTYVTGYTELALEEAPSLDPDAFQGFLMGIKKGADRLTHLVEDLILLMNLDLGKAQQEFEQSAQVHTDLNSVVRRVVDTHVEEAHQKGVTLELECAPQLPAVRLYDLYLSDALRRLVENGIKFSCQDGKHVIVRTRSNDAGVEISVADNGRGIPGEALAHLFERFRQVGRDQWEQQGVGLGLSIVKALVELHGGQVTVESEAGKGSTFIISLPAATTP